MKVLVTGASGFIGTPLCHSLAESGHEIVAMYRNGDRLSSLLHPRITPFKGDITSNSDLAAAIHQCEICFHLAALAVPWAKDPDQFMRVNVDATRAIFELALQEKISRVVFTSTASVFGPANADHPVNETTPLANQLDTRYEISKLACEELVRNVQTRGLDIVTLYPSRVFGRAPVNQSNALTSIFLKFSQRKWRFIPGNGNSIGNYAFIDDVVDGHVKAMSESPPNQRFLLGGENLSFNQIVRHLQNETGARQRLFHVAGPMLSGFAELQIIKAKLVGRPPLITPSFVRKYLKDWNVDCSKARSELGVTETPFAEGLAKTLAWNGFQKT